MRQTQAFLKCSSQYQQWHRMLALQIRRQVQIPIERKANGYLAIPILLIRLQRLQQLFANASFIKYLCHNQQKCHNGQNSYYFIIKTQAQGMSILSNTNYDQMGQAITKLKQAIGQQFDQQLQKYQLLAIKAKIIQEQIIESQLALQKYQKDSHAKIVRCANQAKSHLKSIQENAGQQVDAHLLKELRQLELYRNKLIKLNQSRNQTIALKIQAQIDSLKQRLSNRIEKDKKALSESQARLKIEVKGLKQKLSKIKQQGSQSAIIHIEQLGGSIDEQIEELRAKRKNKKQRFLELLQTIIIKCKQASQNNP